VEYARKIGSSASKSAQVEEEEVADMVGDEDFETDEDEDDELNATKGKKHKHKKGKKRKHHKKHKASKEWFTFVKRAFVGTMDPHEIKQLFNAGSSSSEVSEEAQEVMEL
jgi:endopolyphosphatase